MNKSETIPAAASALLWAAAFCLAVSVYFCLSPFLRFLPPTSPVAVGVVTIRHVSKSRDYLTALLFFLVVPPATLFLQRQGQRVMETIRRAASPRVALIATCAGLVPFLLSPFLYLTTRKEGWTLLLPLLISAGLIGFILYLDRHLWARQMFRPGMIALQAFFLAESASWLIFWYIETSRRMAHFDTLFLEIIFIVFFLLLVPVVGILLARTAAFISGESLELWLRRIALALAPLLVLPVGALLMAPPRLMSGCVLAAISIAVPLSALLRRPPSSAAFRRALALVIIPILLAIVSYTSIASPWFWVDLFHRGESLGPASDYLQGKVPFRDVFVLHGLLDDGYLDAALMQIFGRSVAVSTFRIVVLASCVVPLLWWLGMIIFERLSLAFLVVAAVFVTSADNQRAIFEILTALFLLMALKKGKRGYAAAAGAMASLALFQSLDIGLYSIGGGLLAIAAFVWHEHRMGRPAGWEIFVAFIVGIASGAAPFLIALGVAGALPQFFRISFITLPATIDATWSLPYPDLKRAFTANLTLHGISDFMLSEKLRYLLSPLVIGLAILVAGERMRARREGQWTIDLMVLASFTLLTQRTALGRADFPHQYFSAFFVGPLIAVLFVIFMNALVQSVKRGSSSFAAAFLIGAFAVVSAVVLLWVPDLMAGRLDGMIHYLPRMRRIDSVDPAAGPVQRRIDGLRSAVWKLVPPSGTMFDFSNQPALYFYLDRQNPTRFYQTPLMSPAELQEEAIRSLERRPPAVVLRHSPEGYDVFDGVSNDLRAAAVSAWIDDHYHYNRQVEGVEIWTPLLHPPKHPVAEYLRRIVPPGRVPIEARERLFFPSVATLSGANGVHWQSDLTIANPGPDPIDLRLRFFGKTSEERHVVVPPRQNLIWSDVARTLFGASESYGALRVDFTSGRRPLMTLSTYDSSRRGIRMPTSPISPDSAATPGKQIVFTGLQSRDSRLNLGVVNVGDSDARFRIFITDARGALTGAMLEEGALENESYFLVDAPRLLGLELAPDDILHVQPLTGKALAFLSVVDPATGQTFSISGNLSP
jgi:hypothetical protein